MTLVVKLMSGENLPDESPYKKYRLLTGVLSLNFQSAESAGKPDTVEIYFLGSEEAEVFEVPGNVYVMNSSGKTISTYAPSVSEEIGVFINGVAVTIRRRRYEEFQLMKELGLEGKNVLTLLDNENGPYDIFSGAPTYTPKAGDRFFTHDLDTDLEYDDGRSGPPSK